MPPRLAPASTKAPQALQPAVEQGVRSARIGSAEARGAGAEGALDVVQGLDGGTRFELGREGLRSAMASGVEEIRRCYEDWLKMDPGLAGTLRVRFSIDSEDGIEGKVISVSLVGDAGMGNVAMEGCVMSVVSDLRFEPPVEGPLNVTYPYVFLQSDAGS